MGLEEIKKRIDESIKFINLDTNYSSLEYCHDITIEAQKALKIYEELIVKVQRMNLISDKRELQVDTNYQITEHIKYLEEKYYPKPKTIKEKLNDIINHNATVLDAPNIVNSLIRLRDEIPD